MSTKIIEATPYTQQYRLERVPLNAIREEVFAQWGRERCRSAAFESPNDDPEWLRGYFGHELESLYTYLVSEGDSLVGHASFNDNRDWPLRWHLGEFTVATMPMRRLRLMTPTPAIPDEKGAYDLLFQELKAAKEVDAIYLPEVPLDSYLWQYLESSDVIRRSFRMYLPDAPARRLLLTLDGSFDDYMKKFSSRHRHNLRRAVAKFREEVPEEVRWVKYTKPEDVSGFMDLAVRVSQNSYQWKLFKRGLYLKDLLMRRLMFAAQHGWFRSYILFVGEQPCSFVLGFQHRGRFDHHEIGYDPAWRRHRVGTVLHMFMLEDLFTVDRPNVVDFGEYAPYKEEFATNTYKEAKVLLFNHGVYTWVARAGHQACRSITKATAGMLDRLHLKSKLKKMIRTAASDWHA